MLFKICGLKNIESLYCCEENNVDFYGMIFYEKSPRNILLSDAETLINNSKKLRIKPVGVFVDHEINDLKKIISSIGLKYIQLHGSEDQLYIDKIKRQFDVKIIKKISINNSEDLNIINKFKNIEYLLFDYKPLKYELPGGNSKSFDWNLLKDQKIKLPWFISGGINETNIKNIQNLLNPNGIDLSSGVEVSKGIKSNSKINNLFKKFYDN
jgi:phosphoribosylanthranilate isomerase